MAVASHLNHIYSGVLRRMVLATAVVAGLSLLGMMGVSCLDIALRMAGFPMTGALDLIKILGALTLACSLPYTTAIKGHVSIEYFILQLPYRVQRLIHGLMCLLGVVLLGALTWQCLHFGWRQMQNNVVTSTLQLPIFWLSWVIALACFLSALVLLQHMTHPGRKIVRS